MTLSGSENKKQLTVKRRQSRDDSNDSARIEEAILKD